jgi:tRNA threonylcarbamoyladenosine biosynthesis protein TsaE
MSNSETVHVASTSPIVTKETGMSLASCLEKTPTSVWLQGDLGAGKTTFVQGLAEGLGVIEPVQSPTYALENRYGETLLHIDLYRLDPDEARKIVEESEDFPGVRAIEWSDRVNEKWEGGNGIAITFHEPSPETRTFDITFADIAWPDRETIEALRKEVRLPDHIGVHCDAVGALAKRCAEALLRRSTICRPHALQKAGELHDLLRFVDFVPGMQQKIPHAKEADEATRKCWKEIEKRYPGDHEDACAAFLTDHGYPGLATMIRPHGLRSIDSPEQFETTEQKLLYYADKRIMFNRIVTLKERFDDFARRYEDGNESEKGKRWRRKTMELEREMFGDVIPQ